LSGSFAAPKYLPEPFSSGRTCRTTPLPHRCSASEGPSTTRRPGGDRVGCPRPAPPSGWATPGPLRGPREGGPGPPPEEGSGPPPPGGYPEARMGGPPPGGSGRGGRSPTVTPPGVTPPSGGVKNAVFGRHLVLYNLVGFFPVLISGCGRIFGRGKLPPGGGTPPTPPGGVKNRDFWTPPRNASPGPPRGGSGPSSIDPPLPTPPGPGGVHCLSPYFRGKEGERWGRGVFQHIQTDAFTTPVHCIDRIAYEGVWTKHSGGDGLEVTHSLVGSQNPASQINELRPSVTVTRTSPSPTSRLGLSVIPTRKAIHQSDVVNRPYDMTESTLSVQIILSFLAHFCFLFSSHVVRERSESKQK